MTGVERLFRLARGVRTPLTLASLIVIVFYLVLRLILNLEVFENVGQENTATILQGIIDRLFWLALAGLFLGVFAYLYTFIQGKRLSSNVKLVDASLDKNDSHYEEVEETGLGKSGPLNLPLKVPSRE